MRVDKWIWAVRMVKSRTLAKTFCDGGKVLINGIKAKPSKVLSLDDVVEVDKKEVFLRYKVLGFIPKRVSAELAMENYEDQSPTPETPIDISTENAPRRKRGEGRPTKKDYRNLKKFQDFEGE